MFTITNLKCLLEERTCAIKFIVNHHSVYAKILTFSTVSHVQNNLDYWANLAVSPKYLQSIPFLQGIRAKIEYPLLKFSNKRMHI
jgi:hypothetical protein